MSAWPARLLARERNKMNAMNARIARMTTDQIKDAILAIMKRPMNPEVSTVRYELCKAYEARCGGEAMDAVLDLGEMLAA